MTASWQKEHWNPLLTLLTTNLDDKNWQIHTITYENGQPTACYKNTTNPNYIIKHNQNGATWTDQQGKTHHTHTLIEAQLVATTEQTTDRTITAIMETPVQWSDKIFTAA